MNTLLRFHRFLAFHLLYPILLSTGLAVSMYVVRVIVSDNWRIYANLPWNLFLAWLPYLFSLWAAGLNRLFPRQWWMLLVPGLLWLIFFPNAPYLVTDFLHLENRPYIPLWYDILLLTSFAWTGIFLAVASLRTMQVLINGYLGQVASWLFVAVALGLSGLGIYLGRFDRWNSWDLLLHPRHILADIVIRMANPLENLRFVGFTLLFTAFLLVCYLTFVAVHRVPRRDE